MSKFIARTVEIVFVILLSLILLAFGVRFGSMVSTFRIAIIVTTAMFFLCGLFIFFGDMILQFVNTKVIKPLSVLSTKQMVLIIGVVTFVTKLFFVFLLDVDSTLHPDMKMYHSFANQIANQGEITEYVVYATKHKYTAIYGLILSPFAKLFGEDPKSLTIVLSAGVTLVSILLFDIVRRYSSNTIAFCGILLYNLLPMGLFQTQLLVHETALLFLHILSVWFLLKSFEIETHTARRTVLVVLSCACIATGLSINASGKVILVSMCIASFVKFVGEKVTLKKLLRFGGFIIVFLVSVSIITNAWKGAVDSVINTENTEAFDTEKRVSYGWPIYLGLNYELSGVYNKEDYETYQAYQKIEDVEEAKGYQINLITERAQEYIDNPIRIPLHLFNKIKALWGSLWLPFSYEQGNEVEQFILKGAGGIVYKGLYVLNSVCYCLVLTMILCSCKLKKRKHQDRQSYVENYLNMHSKMVIIGVTLALVLFEISPKYASHLQILVYTIWMFQLKDFYKFSSAVRNKLGGVISSKKIVAKR